MQTVSGLDVRSKGWTLKASMDKNAGKLRESFCLEIFDERCWIISLDGVDAIQSQSDVPVLRPI